MKTTKNNENVLPAVKRILDNYLEMNNHRKTVERYEILKAVYSIDGHFTIEELGDLLTEKYKFPVSRATLYNTLRLFMVIEVRAPEISHAINDLRLKRFHKDGFSLYIYGICSTCQAQITRKKHYQKNK